MILLRAFPQLIVLACLSLTVSSTSVASPQEIVGVTDVTPNVLVFSTSTGNVVASVGPDGALVIGAPPAASTDPIAAELAKRAKSPLRYVVITAADPTASEADAGWGRHGAFVATHENALRRIGGGNMGATQALSSRLMKLGVDRPPIAFSEVLAFDLNGDAIHLIHQKPGYSDADFIVHFHVADLVYLGEVFPGDGYPIIDHSQGGTLSGLVDTLKGLSWVGGSFHVVAARGNVTTGATLKAFRDMVVSVRDRVQGLVNQGRSESEVVAAHPTASFDSQWGHGRVSPDAFVREIYSALKEPQPSKGR